MQKKQILKKISLGIGLALFGAVSTAQAQTPMSDDALFRLDGIEYTASQLPEDLQKQLYDARLEAYKKEKAVLDNVILKLELKRLADEGGKTVDQIAAQLFSVAPPSEQAMRDFFESAKAQIPYPFAQVKGQIAQILSQNAISEKQTAFLSKLKKDKWYEMALKEPLAPLAQISTDGFPSKGAAKSDITIVEFADYQCPHCKTASAALAKVMEKYGDQVKLVFMDLPVNRSGISREVARGATCADQQGQFWAYHDKAFAMQAKLAKDSPRNLAKDLSLDLKAFDQCLASKLPDERLQRSVAEATRLGVNSTPSIYLNGRLQHLHDVETELSKKIDGLLAKR